MAAHSKIRVYGCSLAGIAGSNPAGACKSFVSVVCCQAEVSATGRLLIQRIPTEGGVSGCDVETSTMRRPRPTSAVKYQASKKKLYTLSPFILSLIPIRKHLEFTYLSN